MKAKSCAPRGPSTFPAGSAQQVRNLSSASLHSQLGPSTGQMQLGEGTQIHFWPEGVKLKSEVGEQRDWISFLRTLQNQHFLLNRILMIIMSNVMLIPTGSTRAIMLKRE